LEFVLALNHLIAHVIEQIKGFKIAVAKYQGLKTNIKIAYIQVHRYLHQKIDLEITKLILLVRTVIVSKVGITF
jgi:hypothetical protein